LVTMMGDDGLAIALLMRLSAPQRLVHARFNSLDFERFAAHLLPENRNTAVDEQATLRSQLHGVPSEGGRDSNPSIRLTTEKGFRD
jgi:hypothetical protein